MTQPKNTVAFLSTVLQFIGLALITSSAALVDPRLGLAAGGLFLVVLSLAVERVLRVPLKADK